MTVPGPSYGRFLTERAAEAPEVTALIHVDPDGVERDVSWGELESRANQVARLLTDAGVVEGSLVAVALPNIPEHFFVVYGAWKLGATVLPLRWSLPQWEQEKLLALAAPAVTIVTGDAVPDAAMLTLDQVRASDTLPTEPLADRIAQPAQAIATSGSTGTPKLILKAAPSVVRPRDPMDALTIEPSEVVQLVTSPLYHTNGFICHLRLVGGGKIIIMEKFDAALAVALVAKWQVNHVVLVPTMLQRIARLADVRPEHLSSLQQVFYGGASLAPWVARRWLELVGPDRFCFQYGGTEQIGACMANGTEWLAHEGTVGRPVGCDIRIQDAAGAAVPAGTVGEIYLRPDAGLPPFLYVGAPMPPVTEDGYTTYGDLGWMDADGYVYIADRRVDMVVTGGANVYPAEVEAALSESPAVADVVVIGLPDAEWGQRIHAIVEPANPADPPTDDELRAYCRARLVAYKVPKSIEIVDRMPRTEAGKINRTALIAERADASDVRPPG
jgi:bile acid-coenzyme A ligase